MEKGLKNLQSAGRSAARRERLAAGECVKRRGRRCWLTRALGDTSELDAEADLSDISEAADAKPSGNASEPPSESSAVRPPPHLQRGREGGQATTLKGDSRVLVQDRL